MISYGDLHALLARIFTAHGMPPGSAAILAGAVAQAERDACLSHGLFRIPGYLSSLRSGYVDGAAVPVVEQPRPGTMAVDGARGFAQVALEAGRVRLLEAARNLGIACISIRNAHHYAALATDIEPFADAGLFALAMVNGRSRVAPFGARRAVIGTNPIAFACPRASGAPLLWDMATSAIANADVLMAARDGHAIPAGVALDRHGEPTTDPEAMQDGGALLPFGGHKGAAIATMVELLAAALTGGRFGFEDDAFRYPGATTANAGQLIILIDPAATGGAGAAERVETLLTRLTDAGADRIPGDRRLAARASAAENGIPITQALLAQLQAWTYPPAS
ncbi:MAG: lactate dehydrogenase [Rubritepida sp.]|nr:lactate dehydrogenase [Rubritepida sp.]